MTIMKLYSYFLRFDTGFALNPFGKYCTLATRKLRIRKKAKPGDWVIGTGSAQAIGDKKLVYAIQAKEKLAFSEYWEDPRFAEKRPHKGLIICKDREERLDYALKMTHNIEVKHYRINVELTD